METPDKTIKARLTVGELRELLADYKSEVIADCWIELTLPREKLPSNYKYSKPCGHCSKSTIFAFCSDECRQASEELGMLTFRV